MAKEQIEIAGDGLLVRAPAKINLSLLIAGKRADGFHEIETIMAKVTLFDEILIEPGERPGAELVVRGPHWAPQGESNLAYRACRRLLETCGRRANISITLTKNIPAGAGLGSASSDAAAVLIGLNALLKLNCSTERLCEVGAGLGSDVNFFLGGPLALCTGRGKKIRKLDENFNFAALLILPNVSVSTKEVYANYRHDAALYERLSRQINRHIRKNRIDSVSRMCANMLESSCFSLHEELAELKARVESLDVGPVCLSGSGSAMFVIIDTADKRHAQELQ
ncbi:MAG: 4-(cytidine 5'-diphospho)-2-C-methyl-D-erythritol kinase, partial [Planctomycetota bacterium]